MFIAHLPAGYLLTNLLIPRNTPHCKSLWRTGIIFSIAPDLDLLWFYLVSDRKLSHHHYISHWPLFWAATFCVAWLFAKLLRRPKWWFYIFIAFVNVLLHLVLDSIAATIYWLAPFSNIAINLVHVPAVHSWWVWNFILHWTFALELCLCLIASIAYVRGKRRI